MGEVYRARDTKLGRDVAVKVMPDALAADLERIARFERQAKLLASLNHPNIAALFGMADADGRHFLMMELVEGETLAERLEGRLPQTSGLPLELTLGMPKTSFDKTWACSSSRALLSDSVGSCRPPMAP
jgi:serine/threonine protein kinase